MHIFYTAERHVKWYNIAIKQFGNNYQEPEKKIHDS